MRAPIRLLLAELHAHTTWSDGRLPMRELVDLYGEHRFAVLCITDHVLRSDDPCANAGDWSRGVTPDLYPSYLAEIEAEAERAIERYGMPLLPGAELTYNDPDPLEAAHAVAVGLDQFVSLDAGIAAAMEVAAATGAALIAAHPFAGEPTENETRRTERFSHDPGLAALAHRFELYNRSQRFSWVAEARLPVVAAGDTHTAEHVYGWKTLLPCEHHPEAIVDFLRSQRRAYLGYVSAQAHALSA